MHSHFSALLLILLATPLFTACTATETPSPSPGLVATPAPAPYKIPPLPDFTPDADLTKWTDKGFRIDILNEPAPHPASDQNQAPALRLAWTPRGLALLVTVHDTTPSESEKADSLWDKDSLEIVLSDPAHPQQILQFVISPGIDPAHPKLRSSLHDYRADKSNPAKPTLEAASAKIEGGYIVEALIPFTTVQLNPATGTRLGFQIAINDSTPGPKIRYRWGNADLSFDKSALHQPLILANAPSAPITFALDGDYQAFRRYRLRINSATAQAQQLTLQGVSGQQLAILRHYSGGRARIDLPYPTGFTETNDGGVTFGGLVNVGGVDQTPFDHLTLLAEGKPVAHLTSAPLPSRSEALQQLKVRCNFVFSGNTLPTLDFEDPLAAEDILGAYTLSTRYFDAQLNEVTSAATPGRYAALLHVAGGNGLISDRLFTLYRLPGKLGRRDTLDFTAKDLTLPKDFGLDPALVTAQTPALLDLFKRNFFAELARSDDNAIFLAGLAETPADAPPYVSRTDPWAINSLYIHNLKKKLNLPTAYPYLEHLPPNYAADKTAKFPLIIFLHGSGERGNDLALVKRTGFPAYLEKHPEFPAIVLSPQCPNGTSWQPVEVNELLEQALAKYRVDTDRIYMTGLSMGGFGTWAYACWYPEKLAAAVPICGIGDPKDMARMKNVPTWVFHGQADPTVPIEPDRKCVEALKAAGGNVQFTTYPGVGHDSWTQTYNTPELYTWLLAQSRKPH